MQWLTEVLNHHVYSHAPGLSTGGRVVDSLCHFPYSLDSMLVSAGVQYLKNSSQGNQVNFRLAHMFTERYSPPCVTLRCLLLQPVGMKFLTCLVRQLNKPIIIFTAIHCILSSKVISCLWFWHNSRAHSSNDPAPLGLNTFGKVSTTHDVSRVMILVHMFSHSIPLLVHLV